MGASEMLNWEVCQSSVKPFLFVYRIRDHHWLSDMARWELVGGTEDVPEAAPRHIKKCGTIRFSTT